MTTVSCGSATPPRGPLPSHRGEVKEFADTRGPMSCDRRGPSYARCCWRRGPPKCELAAIGPAGRRAGPATTVRPCGQSKAAPRPRRKTSPRRGATRCRSPTPSPLRSGGPSITAPVRSPPIRGQPRGNEGLGPPCEAPQQFGHHSAFSKGVRRITQGAPTIGARRVTNARRPSSQPRGAHRENDHGDNDAGPNTRAAPRRRAGEAGKQPRPGNPPKQAPPPMARDTTGPPRARSMRRPVGGQKSVDVPGLDDTLSRAGTSTERAQQRAHHRVCDQQRLRPTR